MNNPHGIIVFGANGSGKTTLARELSHILNFKHMDIEDYAFEPSNIPYSGSRSKEDYIKLMFADIKKYGSFVISAVTGNFSTEIASMYDLAIFLEAPLELRLDRIERRQYEKHGKRVHEGGDMFKRSRKFIDFVASRSLSPIEQWAETLVCPVIRMNGTDDYKMTARKIAESYYTLPGDYHLVIQAWIMNSKGEFLITRRAFNKIGYPGMWEVPCGSATVGEESLEATVREAKEECGITLLPNNGTLFSTYQRGNSFYDNWMFRQDFSLSDVVLQDGETIDARAATWHEIADMMERGEFIPFDYLDELFEKARDNYNG